MVLKVFLLITIISFTFAGENRSDDLAYQLVLEKINKKVVPTSYIDEIFNNPSIEKHLEIPERFARPYEKKSWEQYKKLFSLENVELDFEDDALQAVVERAKNRKTGARGLRSIMESSMLDIMFTLPSMKQVKRCIITRETIEKQAPPIYEKQKASA